MNTPATRAIAALETLEVPEHQRPALADALKEVQAMQSNIDRLRAAVVQLRADADRFGHLINNEAEDAGVELEEYIQQRRAEIDAQMRRL